MKQKTRATRHLRTKIAAEYVLILFVIFGIAYMFNSMNRTDNRNWKLQPTK